MEKNSEKDSSGKELKNNQYEKEAKYIKLRHQKHQNYERQKYLEEVGIKTVRGIIKTKLEMWDIGNNLGTGRGCWCGGQESSEYIFGCKMS